MICGVVIVARCKANRFLDRNRGGEKRGKREEGGHNGGGKGGRRKIGGGSKIETL